MTGGADEAEERARLAFRHAVEHELEAIRAHEAAAARHEEIAARHEQGALTADEAVRDELIQMAARERERAARARSRAAAARARLRKEGEAPD